MPSKEKVWRLLDANANRAREGLRVVEDSARFVLDNAKAARGLRDLRHRLDAVVRARYALMLKHRDVDHDAGRTNASKPHKTGVDGLMTANLKRAQEALRVLEEYGRVVSPKAVSEIQAIRFEAYKWEKKLLG